MSANTIEKEENGGAALGRSVTVSFYFFFFISALPPPSPPFFSLSFSLAVPSRSISLPYRCTCFGRHHTNTIPLRASFQYSLSQEQFEKLYLQPGGRQALGDLSKRFGNPTPVRLNSHGSKKRP